MNRVISVWIGSLFLANIAPALAGQTLNSEIQKFSGIYQEGLKEYGIVGSSFMLVQDNQVVHREFHGYADREKKRRVDQDTIYHWASITKTMTGIAIMQLRDRGKLKLSDPIVKYLPELRKVRNTHGDMDKITLRHLLSHTAGFRAPTWPWKSEDWHPHEPTRWEQLVAMLPYTEVHFKPGGKYSYSNPAIIFLGRVIELISGDDYEVYIDKNIFKPLQMHRSYFDATPYHLLKHRSRSYWIRDGQTVPAAFDVDTGITVSNGGLNAPFGDFRLYLNFLMGDPRLARQHRKVLKRSSLLEMWKPVVEVPGRSGGRKRRDHMGLCFFIEHNYGMRFIGHSGGQNAFVTHFFLRPKTRSAYVIAYNTSTWEAMSANLYVPNQTKKLDQRLKNHLFEHVFPLMGGKQQR